MRNYPTARGRCCKKPITKLRKIARRDFRHQSSVMGQRIRHHMTWVRKLLEKFVDILRNPALSRGIDVMSNVVVVGVMTEGRCDNLLTVFRQHPKQHTRGHSAQ